MQRQPSTYMKEFQGSSTYLSYPHGKEKYKREEANIFFRHWLTGIKGPRKYIITGILEDDHHYINCSSKDIGPRAMPRRQDNQGDRVVLGSRDLELAAQLLPRERLCLELQDQLSSAVNEVLSDDFMDRKRLRRALTKKNGSQKGKEMRDNAQSWWPGPGEKLING